MSIELMHPTDEEDAAINAGIALDPDTYELTAEDFAKMRPMRDYPEMLAQLQAASRELRGRPRGTTKRTVSISLDEELVQALRASGKGWQTRVNATLRQAFMGQ